MFVAYSWLLGWAGAVAVVNLGAMQLARTQAITHVGRSGRKVPQWLMVGEVLAARLAVAVAAALSVSLARSRQPGHRRLDDRRPRHRRARPGRRAACVTAWMVDASPRPQLSLLIGAHTVPFQHMLSILFTLGVAIFGVLTVARWAFGQLKTNADVGSQSESASLLLQEYEQRGVGWLWQVDGENRVTYISSRMTALLGRPASAAARPFAAVALLGGHAELGRVLLEKQPFNSLEMELKTARGRAGSRSPATRSSTPPAASKASAASAATSPRSARRRSG
jgi:PAS domain-containing protein